jgi:hypothetical protein
MWIIAAIAASGFVLLALSAKWLLPTAWAALLVMPLRVPVALFGAPA